MSFGEERCSSYVLIPPQNHDPAARKRRENRNCSAVDKIAQADIEIDHNDLLAALRQRSA